MNRNCDCARREVEFMAIIARLEARVALLETKLAATEVKLAATEVKLVATEVKLVATEAKLVATEAKLVATEAKLVATEAKLASTEAKLAATESELAKAMKNSSNSSKPPSSDIVKPSKSPRPKGGRRIGGQAGHPRHERDPFPPEAVDRTIVHELRCCPGCGGRLVPARKLPDVIQQVEVAEKLVRVEEHQGKAYWCPRCRRFHWAPLPEEVVRAGLVGPHLTALIAYLKGACHASFSTIRKFLRDVAHVTISRSQLAKVLGKVTGALEGPYRELLARLPLEPRLNVDETGHPENGRGLWTWCFRAEMYTLFKIDPSRGSDVLVEVLGKEFDGVLGCDYFSAYRKYMGDFGILVQFCLAHLIRDVKFLTTLPNPATRAYGEKVLDGLRRLFRTIHRRDRIGAPEFQRAMERARQGMLRKALGYVPDRSEAQNLAKRFREHGEAYFRFITTPGIDPTNNLAEQAIRFVVIDRLVTQGTRSEEGRRWCERIWTTMATCDRQARSAFEYLLSAVKEFFAGRPVPSLVSSGP